MWQKFLAWLHRLSSPKSAAPALPAPDPVPPKSSDPADNVPTVPATPIVSGEPLWFTIARGELGQAEIPGPRNNDRIIEYEKVCVSRPNWSDSETAWCSCFVSWCLEKAGIASTRNAWAQSYTKWGDDVSKNPPIGALVVFRWSASSGHIGFFGGWRDDNRTLVRVLGGNQSDSVCYKVFGTSNIVGYRWPRNIPVVGVPPEPAKKPWPIKGWQPEYTQFIRDHATTEMINSDKSKLIKNWRDYDQKQLLGWIIQSIAWAECGWDRTNRYVEKGMSGDPVTKRDVTASEGLLQLSYSDSLYYGAQFDWSKDRELADNDPNKTIFDPLLNLDAGIKIMTKLLKNDGDFVSANRRYWSTLRKERDGYAVMFKKLQELLPG